MAGFHDTMVSAGATNPRPGIYVLDGVVHADTDALLRAQGLEPTPERVEAVATYLEELFAIPFMGRAEW